LETVGFFSIVCDTSLDRSPATLSTVYLVRGISRPLVRGSYLQISWVVTGIPRFWVCESIYIQHIYIDVFDRMIKDIP